VLVSADAADCAPTAVVDDVNVETSNGDGSGIVLRATDTLALPAENLSEMRV